jgi:hypothetical protein
MKDFVCAVWQFQAGNFSSSGRVEHAKLHTFRVGGENRKVDPKSIPGGAERVGFASQ